MGLFGPSLPKRVTKEEYRRIKNRLYDDLDGTERAQVDMLFRADLDEPGGEQGITAAEFEAAVDWLEGNQSKHSLEAEDVAFLKKYFAEHLAD